MTTPQIDAIDEGEEQFPYRLVGVGSTAVFEHFYEGYPERNASIYEVAA
ncbi:MAG: hypothetical protein HQM06_14380 [Magnetococcales bacterium]|nr:hypothetical protein [Magnetococcales bacterium]